MSSFDIIFSDLEEIVYFLKKNLQIRDVCAGILHQKIVEQAAVQRGIEVADEEIQAEGDRQRRQNRLESASSTFAWLKHQLITADDWEQGIRDRLLMQKLSNSLFSHEVEKYFAEHRTDFDSVILYQIIVPHQKLSVELFYQIEEEEISFYEAAHYYDIAEDRRQRCGFEGRLYRHGLKPDISAVVFGAEPQKVLRPIKTEQGYHILMVEELIPAELTPELQKEISAQLFQEWLTSELNYVLHSSSSKGLIST